MKLLAIETCTEACSAALAVDGIIEESFQIAPRAHAELILAMVDRLLVDAGLTAAQLDLLAFGRGPGAFTGVRIGTGVVQGLAYALDIPVVPISSLAALAHGARRELGHDRIVAAIDARMGEVYWGAYRDLGERGITVLAEEQVSAPEEVEVIGEHGWAGVGSGWATHHRILVQQLGERLLACDSDRYPHARDVAELALGDPQAAVAAERAMPVYLRDRVVQRPGS